MNEKELKEMEHISELLKSLQQLQAGLYGHDSITLDIEFGTYKHCLNVTLRTNVNHAELGTNPDCLWAYDLMPWHNKEENDAVYEEIVRKVESAKRAA